MIRIINDDFSNFAFELYAKGYSYKQIAIKAIEKFFLKKVSEKTVKRAIKKKSQKADNNRTKNGQ